MNNALFRTANDDSCAIFVLQMMIVVVEDWVWGWVGATSRGLSKHIVLHSCSKDVYMCCSDPDSDCNPHLDLGYM